MLSRRADEGAVIPLVLVYAMIAAGMAVAAIDASATFLAWRDLGNLADGAALAAAQTVDEAAFYAGAGDGVVPLSEQQIGDVVARYLADAPDVAWRASLSADGRTVSVSLQRQVHLPFVAILRYVDAGYADGQVPVAANAHARAPIRP